MRSAQRRARERTTASNKGMKLTKLSAAPLLGRSAASCPRRSTSDAGTASQLIPGVRRTWEQDRRGRQAARYDRARRLSGA